METTKPLSFNASALDFFIFTIISGVAAYIPLLGWAFLLNYSGEWFSDRALVNGKKIKYQASYVESLKFVFINMLLLIITLGIYMFWFYPKIYKYATEHIDYVDETAAAPVVDVPTETVAPVVSEPVVPIVAEPIAPSAPDTSVTPSDPTTPATPPSNPIA